MARPPQDRTDRLSQLQELAQDDSRDFPKLDANAWDTALAELGASEKRAERRRRVGWVVIGLVIIVAALLVVSGMF